MLCCILLSLTLCDLIVCSPPSSSVCGILQARILEWVAIPLLQGIFPDPGVELRSPALQEDSIPSESQGSPHLRNVLRIHPCCRLRQNFPCFKGWIIFHCVDTPQAFYLLTYWWTLGLLLRVCVLSRFSPVLLFVTLRTVALQAPLFMGFSRQEFWSGLPHPSPWVASTPWLIRIILLWTWMCYQNSELTHIHSLSILGFLGPVVDSSKAIRNLKSSKLLFLHSLCFKLLKKKTIPQGFCWGS